MLSMRPAHISLICISCYVLTISTHASEKTTNKTIGNVVDNFSLTELMDDQSQIADPANIDSVHIISTLIYEKNAGITAAGSKDRNYGKRFNAAHTRYICWEITLRHNQTLHNRDLNFRFQLKDQDGNILATNRADSWIAKEKEISNHNACWGSDYTNNWESGEYFFVVESISKNQAGDNNLKQLIAFTLL